MRDKRFKFDYLDPKDNIYTGKNDTKRDYRRFKINKEIKERLEDLFKQNDKPSLTERISMAKFYEIPEKTLSVWFQNRRTKEKRINKAKITERKLTAINEIFTTQPTKENYKSVYKLRSSLDNFNPNAATFPDYENFNCYPQPKQQYTYETNPVFYEQPGYDYQVYPFFGEENNFHVEQEIHEEEGPKEMKTYNFFNQEWGSTLNSDDEYSEDDWELFR